MDKSLKKELLLYLCITIILVIVSVLNNKFWKLGKPKQIENNINYLESGNIVYNVPYEEIWFD